MCEEVVTFILHYVKLYFSNKWGRPLLWCGPHWKSVWHPWFRLSGSVSSLSLTGLLQPSSARFGSGPGRCRSAASAGRSPTEPTVSPPAEPWPSSRLSPNPDTWWEGGRRRRRTVSEVTGAWGFYAVSSGTADLSCRFFFMPSASSSLLWACCSSLNSVIICDFMLSTSDAAWEVNTAACESKLANRGTFHPPFPSNPAQITDLEFWISNLQRWECFCPLLLKSFTLPLSPIPLWSRPLLFRSSALTYQRDSSSSPALLFCKRKVQFR